MTASNTTQKNAPRVQHVEIDSGHAGQRLDNFLMTFLKGAPRTLIYRLLRKGEVRVNKGRAKAQYRLQAGDIIRIPPVRLSPAKSSPNLPETQLEKMRGHIMFEDADLLIINKPAGMAVHGGSGVSSGVIEVLRQAFPDARRLELVHRLDKDTSGCLLIAKKAGVLKHLHAQIREGEMEKEYLTLLKGCDMETRFSVDLPLRKNVTRSGERIVTVDHEAGKEALTDFHVQQRFSDCALVAVQLHTGRTHQIRVHSQAAGYPIAGDDKYGHALFNREMKKKGLRRLFLHARRLRFVHPGTDETMNVSAPLPDDLKEMIRLLEKERSGL